MQQKQVTKMNTFLTKEHGGEKVINVVVLFFVRFFLLTAGMINRDRFGEGGGGAPQSFT